MMQLAEVEKYINDLDYVSFVNLEQEWPKEFHGGDLEITSEKKNTVYWSGLTQNAVNIIKTVLKNRDFVVESTSPFTYLLDGGRCGNYPIATQNRNYKTPRWLPIIFRKAKEWEKK